MGDSLTTVIAIALAAILMFVFPLMAVSERSDDISQLTVQTATNEFVDDVRTTGRMTYEDYEAFLDTINSTGNTFDVEIELQLLDDNPSVKVASAESTKIGENVYYNLYTSQIEEQLTKNKRITLKEGDMISVTVKNTNTTISQLLRNFFYQVTGNDTYQIAAQHGGIVTVNGAK